jgi:predicted nucleic acid-binding protein
MENMSECSELLEDLYHIDIQSCFSSEAGIDRVKISKMSEARQRNLLHYFVSQNFGKHLSKEAIDEIRKRIHSKKIQDSFTISEIKFTIHRNMLVVEALKG